MKTYLVLTVTCPDRPGIVERITEVLVRFSANWEESRMARLGGDFAGILKVSVAQEEAAALAQALRQLADDEMAITVKVTQPEALPLPPGSQLYQLRLSGADHEGIVHKVAAYLADEGVNVESMETEVAPAPVSGSPLFRMQAEIRVPPALPLAALQANLEQLGHELGVDVTVRHPDSGRRRPADY